MHIQQLTSCRPAAYRSAQVLVSNYWDDLGHFQTACVKQFVCMVSVENTECKLADFTAFPTDGAVVP